MRASTSFRILLAIVVGIATFAAILALTGDESARRLLRTFVLLAIAVGGLGWLVYRFRILPRRDAFAGQARELGLRADHGDPLGVLDRPFALFRWAGTSHELENTARGVRAGRELTIVDYWFIPAGATRRERERYTCVLTPADGDWPDLAVVPERLAARLRSTFAMPDIRTESDGFNRRFEVRSNDRRFASAFLDQRMMAWLLEQEPGVGFEIRAGTTMLFAPRPATSVDDLGRAVGLYDRFLERIPRVVRTEGG